MFYLLCSGSFSCIFTNQPTKRDVETHLRAFGFHVVACDAKDNVLQAYFFAQQLGQPDVFFLCEFVLIYSRRFFQATFKCKVQYERIRGLTVGRLSRSSEDTHLKRVLLLPIHRFKAVSHERVCLYLGNSLLHV